MVNLSGRCESVCGGWSGRDRRRREIEWCLIGSSGIGFRNDCFPLSSFENSRDDCSKSIPGCPLVVYGANKEDVVARANGVDERKVVDGAKRRDGARFCERR